MPDGIKTRFLIVGAGPTGLGAAYRLKELGISDFLIVDSARQAGGLATSFQDPQGFTWDIGGHVQFSHYRYFDEVMSRALGKEGWLTHERESWVWMRKRFVPYPFQNNLRYLPKQELWRCVEGLVELYKYPNTRAPRNFAEWVRATFGAGISEIFMEPYNFKVWAHPLGEMSYEWVGERVAVTDLARTLFNVLHEKDDLSWGPNNTFQFPKRGGTGAIWESVANLVGREKILLNSAVVKIEPRCHRVRLHDGREISYEALLSTMPIDRLAESLPDASPNLREASSALRYSSSNIVGIGLEGPMPDVLRKKCWMYFPEPDCPFYRVTVFSNYSPENVPQPGKQWSLMAEVSESTHKPVSEQNVIESVLSGLKATGLILPETRVVSQWRYRAKHGYPTPSLERNALLKRVHAELEPLKVYSRGRFGGWKYEVSNQDHSFMQGVEWTNRLLMGIPETTYFFPNTANANWGQQEPISD